MNFEGAKRIFNIHTNKTEKIFVNKTNNKSFTVDIVALTPSPWKELSSEFQKHIIKVGTNVFPFEGNNNYGVYFIQLLPEYEVLTYKEFKKQYDCYLSS